MKYNKDNSIMRIPLTDEEKVELNKNKMNSQKSLVSRRNSSKAKFKNSLAALGAGALGTGLAYGAVKGTTNLAGLGERLKAKGIDKKIYNRVHSNMDEVNALKMLRDAYSAKGHIKREAAKNIFKESGVTPNVLGMGGLTGAVIGHSARDRYEVKKFLKEKYGDNPYSSIRMNEKRKILDQREKQAFNIINESFEKIAKLTDEEQKEYGKLTPKAQELTKQNNKDALNVTAKAYAGLGGVYGGTAAINNARRNGELDGVVRRYHNTRTENVKNIKDKGILSDRALDKDNLTRLTTGLPEEQIKGKVYVAKTRSGARSAGVRRQQLDDGLSMFYTPDPNVSFVKSLKNHKTMKINIPLDEYKKLNIVDNPEFKGAKNLKDVLAKNKAGEIPGTKFEAVMGHLKLNKGTDTVLGDMPSKFIKGGKEYKKRTLKDFGRHIKNNPKMFAKGLGKAGIGAGIVAGSAYLLKGDKETKKRMKEFRKNEDIKRYNELSRKAIGLK